MAQTTSHNIDSIQEFYTPRVQELIQQTQPQQIRRPVQLSDITEHSKEDEETTPGCLDFHKAGDEFKLFWSWLEKFLANRNAKDSTKLAVKPAPPRKETHSRSLPSHNMSRPHQASVTSSIASLEREAQYTAQKEMLEYEAARYSLWGEIVYHYKAWRLKRAKNKADADRRRPREEKAKGQMVQVADTISEHEPFQPGKYHTLASPTLEIHPTIIRAIDNMNSDGLPSRVKKIPPTHTRNKSSGEVSKHPVKINHLPSIHNSVHLSEGPWNDPSEDVPVPPLRNKRKSSTVTAFGDFMRRPSEVPLMPIARLAEASSYVTKSQDQDQPQPLKSNFYQQGSSDSQRINAAQVSAPENQHCGLCGSLNSPNTHYGDQGVWLCSACRSPTFATERPPSSFSVPRKERAAGKRKQSSPSRSREDIKSGRAKQQGILSNGHCESCNIAQPPMKFFAYADHHACAWCGNKLTFSAESPQVSPLTPEFPSCKPAPLNLTKTFSGRRSQYTIESPVSPMSTDPFSNFDSDNSNAYTTNPSTPPQHRPTNSESSLPPTPYPKDIIYTTPTSSRLSFYPSTPTSTNPGTARKDSDTLPPLPPLPPPSQTKDLPNIPPIPKEPRPTRFPIRTSSLSGPRATTTLSHFPFAAPPIPNEMVHRPQRSSSIYPEDGLRERREERDTYMLPALQFDGRGTLTERKKSGVKRDTGFYDFWEPILEEK